MAASATVTYVPTSSNPEFSTQLLLELIHSWEPLLKSALESGNCSETMDFLNQMFVELATNAVFETE